MNFMFDIFPIFFMLTFALILGMIIFSIVKSAKQWNKNNNSPRLTVDATVVGKRQDVSHHNHGGVNNVGMHTTSSTRYYVTFQGTRYLDFVRK